MLVAVAQPVLVAQPVQQDMNAPNSGPSSFQIWGGPVSPSAPPLVDYQIVGSDFSQVLELTVEPAQTVTAEPGTMLYMSPGMALDADIGGLGQGCKRCCCAGESLFRLHLKNTTQTAQKISLTARYPARIVPIDLREHTGLIVNRGAFLAALGTDWRINLQMVGSLGTACCAGQGLFMNTLHGQSMAFLAGGGTVMHKQLAVGEEMIVDPHSVLAFANTVQLGIRRAGGCMVCCCAGQGLFNAVLTGPGLVMLHSMSLGKLRAAIAPSQGGGQGAANAGGQS